MVYSGRWRMPSSHCSDTRDRLTHNNTTTTTTFLHDFKRKFLMEKGVGQTQNQRVFWRRPARFASTYSSTSFPPLVSSIPRLGYCVSPPYFATPPRFWLFIQSTSSLYNMCSIRSSISLPPIPVYPARPSQTLSSNSLRAKKQKKKVLLHNILHVGCSLGQKIRFLLLVRSSSSKDPSLYMY